MKTLHEKRKIFIKISRAARHVKETGIDESVDTQQETLQTLKNGRLTQFVSHTLSKGRKVDFSRSEAVC